jgi:nucleoside-diphosphate-sugar epimerase
VRCLHSEKTGIVNICNPQRNTTLEFVQEAAKYMPLEYETVDVVRMYDKEDQRVSGEVMEMDYTPIEDGIRMSLR